MHELSKITIIGTGRVAKSLANIFHQKGMLNEIYGRNSNRAQQIVSGDSQINITSSLDFTDSLSNTFIVCISDSNISLISQQITLPSSAVLLHTSGSVDIKVLDRENLNYGVLYPVQTFTDKRLENLEETPILIDANNEHTLNKINILASDLSHTVHICSQEERELLHVSAVFASNFTNRIIHASQEILNETRLPNKILEPLLTTSIQNALIHGPQKALTGPAKRNDYITISKHTELLKDKHDLKEIYQILTKYISKTNNK